MRRLLCGLIMIVSCGAASAAKVVVDPGMTFGPLGLGEHQPEVFNQLPGVTIDIPLPAEINNYLPEAGGREGGGFDFRPGSPPTLPELPGLSSLNGLSSEVELPGLDGLPIRTESTRNTNIPRIPGIDGLPLGFGRQ